MRAWWLAMVLLVGCVAELPTSGCRETELFCEGACVDAQRSRAHCGGCGRSCAGLCVDGTCVPCPAQQTVCDGVCVDTASDLRHCGNCGTVCPSGLARASTVCAAGACALRCEPASADCNARLDDGCETDIGSDTQNCGSCGLRCSIPGGTASCAGGICTLASCSTGRADCDQQPTNGCEVNLGTSTSHCGMCGLNCALPNATSSCTDGRCRVAMCSPGFADCDLDSGNGCEVSLGESVEHCGGCGQRCAPPNAVGVCTGARCTVGSCLVGFADCDGRPENGCEVNVGADAQNCGSCGRRCALPNAAPACAGGQCVVGPCAAGFANCNGVASDGCETDIRSNTANCGGCGVTCRYANAAALCTNGACTIGGCNSGYANCNSSAFDGCEVNTQTSYFDCGRCGNACGGASCSNGTCQCTNMTYPYLCPPSPVDNEFSCWGGTTPVNCASMLLCGGQRRLCVVGRTSRCTARAGFTCCTTSSFFCDHPDAPCWNGAVNCQTIQNCGSTGWRACNAGLSGSPCSNTCR